jgi:hypothetical protein
MEVLAATQSQKVWIGRTKTEEKIEKLNKK